MGVKHMFTTYKAIGFFASVAFISSAFFLKETYAAPVSPCKGLEEKACRDKEVIQGTKACNWIIGYKTVAGSERKSYCRSSTKKAS